MTAATNWRASDGETPTLAEQIDYLENMLLMGEPHAAVDLAILASLRELAAANARMEAALGELPSEPFREESTTYAGGRWIYYGNLYQDEKSAKSVYIRELRAFATDAVAQKKALLPYVRHGTIEKGVCAAMKHSDWKCDCGLAELLAAADKEASA